MEEEMEKFATAYLRVSTKEQVENFSLDNQLEQIKRKAELEGYTIIKVFREEGESAKTTERPQLKELIQFSTNKDNKIKAIFVYKYDRLNRNQLDFLLLRKMFAKNGISLISATEISGETPEASFVQSLLSSFAEFENTIRAQRVQQGMLARFKSGLTSSVAHPGYKKVMIDGKNVEVPDGERFIVLQSVWKKIAYENWSIGAARRYLNESGLFNLTKQAAGKVFANTFYMGILQSKKYGKAQGKHQAMIDAEVYYRARDTILGKIMRIDPKNKKFREELPLRRFLRCIKCNSLLTGGGSRSKTGKIIFYYNCQNRSHKYFGFNANKANVAFFEMIQKLKATEKAYKYYEKIMRETYEEEYHALEASSTQIRKDIDIIEQTLIKLKRKHLEGIYNDYDFQEMRGELESEKVSKMQLLGSKKIDKIDIDTILAWNHYYLTHLDDIWLKAPLECKLAMAGSIFPNGLKFDGTAFIEPQIAHAYRLNEFFQAPQKPEYTCVYHYRTLLASIQENYEMLSNFSPFFAYAVA